MVRKRSRPDSVPRAGPRRPEPRCAQNRELSTQTRKVLGKHYRAKYGVR
jgi:hypothetical protein